MVAKLVGISKTMHPLQLYRQNQIEYHYGKSGKEIFLITLIDSNKIAHSKLQNVLRIITFLLVSFEIKLNFPMEVIYTA